MNVRKEAGKISKKVRESKPRLSLTLTFCIVIFLILLIAISIAGVIVSLLMNFKLATDLPSDFDYTKLIVIMMAISIFMGTLISFLVVMFPLKPINTLISNLNALASGEYETRLEYKGMLSAIPCFNELTESFNKLALELGSTEMLRSDFINSFSHEFKTPIVSIAGFAKLLKNHELSESEKELYLNAIEEESLRLSEMATNILALTRVENLNILSDVRQYNLSEQIRSCVLLLENKWSEKSIEFSLGFNEHIIEANEELMKQVLINLLDNAVKFTPRHGSVEVDIIEDVQSITVKIKNTGIEIPPEKIDKIWGKYYRADDSHSTKGNGIGLAIVQKIVTLHKGSVGCTSGKGVTEFAITLPKEQNAPVRPQKGK